MHVLLGFVRCPGPKTVPPAVNPSAASFDWSVETEIGRGLLNVDALRILAERHLLGSHEDFSSSCPMAEQNTRDLAAAWFFVQFPVSPAIDLEYVIRLERHVLRLTKHLSYALHFGAGANKGSKKEWRRVWGKETGGELFRAYKALRKANALAANVQKKGRRSDA